MHNPKQALQAHDLGFVGPRGAEVHQGSVYHCLCASDPITFPTNSQNHHQSRQRPKRLGAAGDQSRASTSNSPWANKPCHLRSPLSARRHIPAPLGLNKQRTNPVLHLCLVTALGGTKVCAVTGTQGGGLLKTQSDKARNNAVSQFPNQRPPVLCILLNFLRTKSPAS